MLAMLFPVTLCTFSAEEEIVPTIPLPQPPEHYEDDGGEFECYERIDFCDEVSAE
ncbi:hypothetical protein COOONC_08591 [Cooperia oncophora]